MRYGTLPIVRMVGGLADSVVPVTPGTLKAGTATGFGFAEFTAEALLGAVREAVALHGAGGAKWDKVRRTAMARDSSWESAASQYEDLYTRVFQGTQR
jgi:starch synthase